MSTKLTDEIIRERFASRRWAVNLSVNGLAVNHEPPEEAILRKYRPLAGENDHDATIRFAAVVRDVAEMSFTDQVMLDIIETEKCNAEVFMWIQFIIKVGDGMPWAIADQLHFDSENLFVNLWLTPNDPATPRAIDHLINDECVIDDECEY